MVQLPPLSNSRTFLSPQKETLYLLAITPHSPFLQSLANSNLLSLSMDLPALDIDVSGIIRYVTFVSGFCHLNMVFSRFIHVSVLHSFLFYGLSIVDSRLKEE